MNHISFNPSQQSPSNNGHNPIGSSGSFWLPPKMSSEKFESSLPKKNSGSNSNKQTNDGSLFAKNLAKTTEVKSNHLLRGTQNSNLSSIPGNLLQNSSNALNFTKSTPVTGENHTAVNGSNLYSFNPQFFNGFTVHSSSFPTNLSANPLAIPQHHASQDPFREEISSLPKGFNGTRTATSKNYDFEPPQHNSPKSSQGVIKSDDFVERVQDCIERYRIGFSNQNGVARFAFSFENGDSVSVRIEQMNDQLQICFISDSVTTRQFLSDMIINSSGDNHPLNDPSIHCHIFSSYQEMDETFINNN